VGERAEQRLWVRQYSRRRQPRGDEVTVLAGGTSVEELIEGLVIGLG
jgi:ZIP family zinc transporter